jgi:paraquat-inducible protein B
MYEGTRGSVLEDVPTAVAVSKRRRPPQLIWLIPIVAALIGGWLAVKSIIDRGPTVTITFKTAEGLEAGKTKIKYKDVDIGDVTAIHLSDDHSSIVVTAEFAKRAEKFLVDDTRFWVVRPRVGGGQVSGLGTLFSGSYIGMDIGHAKAKRRAFTGLEIQPIITGDVPGRQFVLHTENLSVDIGAPIFFRRTQVGRVVVHELDQDGKGVTIKVFVNAPYDQQVNANTRFWDASGIDVTLDASGVKVNTQSIVSILIGGLAFETPSGSGTLPEAEENALFSLYPTRADAMKQPDQQMMLFVMYFPDSLRGLTVGAPVEFNGVLIGEVKSIRVEFIEDARQARQARFPVTAAVYPGRLRAMTTESMTAPDPAEQKVRFDRLIEGGVRAQIRTGSLITGQLYVAIDTFPNAAPAKIDWTKNPPVLPTEPGTMKELQATLMNISKKIESMPLEQIGGDLRQALQSLNRTLVTADQAVKRLDKDVSPAAKATLEDARRMLNTADRTLASDAPLQQDLRTSLRELTRAAQSLRELTDLLERQPESLIRGKKESAR